jgi:hypothetical protein
MPYTISDFLKAEMSKRDMSVLRFSHFVGVSHTSIHKFLEYGQKDVGYPSVDFVIKLAKATNTDVGMIMALIDPTVPLDPPETGELSLQTRILAGQIEELSEHDRKMVEAFVQTIKAHGEK